MRHFLMILCILLAAQWAHAWEAKCYRQGETGVDHCINTSDDNFAPMACNESDAGPMVARGDWLGEHGCMARMAMQLAGIPGEILESWDISVFTNGENGRF